MSPPRFYVSMLPDQGIVSLEPGDALHASNVLRLERDQSVVLFDGLGQEASGRIIEVSKKSTRVEIQRRGLVDRELPIDIEMYVALPKGDRQKALIDGLTQLGVARLTPLITERCVAQPNENAVLRLRKSVIESCKQCGRNRLMQISEPISVPTLCELAAVPNATRVFAHPYGNEKLLPSAAGRSTAVVQCAIGPEGGFTDGEVGHLAAFSWRQISLGERILRVEVAAVALAAFYSLSAEA